MATGSDPRIQVLVSLRDQMTAKYKALGQTVNQHNKQMLTSFRNMGIAMTMVGAAGTMLTNKLVQSSRSVSNAWGQVATIMGEDLGGAMDQYGAQVKRIVADLAVQGGTVAMLDGLYQALSKSIGNTGDVMEFMDIAAKGAAAGNVKVAETVDAYAGAINAYRLTVADTQRVADIYFKTIQKGDTTMQKLTGQMGGLYSITAQLGTPLEEVHAAVATLTSGSQASDEVITELTSTMNAFIKPTEGMTAAAQALGFENATAMVKTMGMAGALDALKTATGGSEQALAEMFPNVRALKAILPLVGVQAGAFAANIGEMYNATGSADEAFKTMAQTSEFAFRQVENRIAAASEELGANMGPSALAVKESIAGLAEGMVNLDNATGGAISAIAVQASALMTAIGPMIATISQIGLMIMARKMHVAAMGEEGVAAMTLKAKLGVAALAGAGILTFMGALTAEAPSVRAAFSLMTGAVVAYTVAKKVATIAEISFLSVATAGIGTAVAVSAAIYGISTIMHQQADAADAAAASTSGLNSVFGNTANSAYLAAGATRGLTAAELAAQMVANGLGGANSTTAASAKELADAIRIQYDELYHSIEAQAAVRSSLALGIAAMIDDQAAMEASRLGISKEEAQRRILAGVLDDQIGFLEDTMGATGDLTGATTLSAQEAGTAAGIFDILTAANIGLTDEQKNGVTTVGELRSLMRDLGIKTDEAIQPTADLDKASSDLFSTSGDLAGAQADLIALEKNHPTELGLVTKAVGEYGDASGIAASDTLALGGAINGLATSGAQGELGGLATAADGAAGSVDGVNTSLDTLFSTLDGSLTAGVSQYLTDLGLANESLDDLIRAQQEGLTYVTEGESNESYREMKAAEYLLGLDDEERANVMEEYNIDADKYTTEYLEELAAGAETFASTADLWANLLKKMESDGGLAGSNVGIGLSQSDLSQVMGKADTGDWWGAFLDMIPGLQRGGTVEKTGLALVHEGEKFSGVGPGAVGLGGVSIASIIINASSREGGQAAAAGLMDGLRNRGIRIGAGH